MPITPEQKSQLDLASERVASGKAGAASATNAGDVANLAYAAKHGYKYSPISQQDGLANALLDPNKLPANSFDYSYQNPPDPGASTGMNWMQDWMKNAFGDQSKKDEITVTGLGEEKDRLLLNRNSRIEALDTQYATNLADLQQRNKDTGNALKARLIKLGISPSDSAWSNAEQGQIDRDRQAEARLRSEYLSNKAKVESDSDQQITQLAMQENTQKFNAQVQNMNNWLTKVGQGINLFQIFSQRDESEKNREQQAYKTLLDYQGTMSTLDQKKQETIAKNFIDNAQKGLYNISDKSTLEMLAKMERDNPDYLTGLTNIATQGLSDRLLDKTKKELEISKTKADIAKLRSGSSGGSNDKETKAFYDDIDSQLTKLSAGKTDWGTAFSTIKSKYGAPDNVIDTLLNKNIWSKPGAYEEIQKTRKADQPFTFVMPNTNQ